MFLNILFYLFLLFETVSPIISPGWAGTLCISSQSSRLWSQVQDYPPVPILLAHCSLLKLVKPVTLFWLRTGGGWEKDTDKFHANKLPVLGIPWEPPESKGDIGVTGSCACVR